MNLYKICTQCNISKNIKEDFYGPILSGGKYIIYKKVCKECEKEKSRIYMKNNYKKLGTKYINIFNNNDIKKIKSLIIQKKKMKYIYDIYIEKYDNIKYCGFRLFMKKLIF